MTASKKKSSRPRSRRDRATAEGAVRLPWRYPPISGASVKKDELPAAAASSLQKTGPIGEARAVHSRCADQMKRSLQRAWLPFEILLQAQALAVSLLLNWRYPVASKPTTDREASDRQSAPFWLKLSTWPDRKTPFRCPIRPSAPPVFSVLIGGTRPWRRAADHAFDRVWVERPPIRVDVACLLQRGADPA